MLPGIRDRRNTPIDFMLKRLGIRASTMGQLAQSRRLFRREFKRNGGDKISVLQPGSQDCRKKTAQIRNLIKS